MILSIVIPALNEEKTIGICVEKAKRAIKEFNIDGEVVVVDNSSTDNTRELAERAGARVVRVAGRGYGAACMGGFNAARGEFIILGDADDSYNLEEIRPFFDKLKEGFDFVMGNRFKGKIEKGAMPFLHRYIGTPFLTWLMNWFFKTGIGDTNCGMRGLTKKAFSRMRLKASGMEFATEMVIKASLRGLRIAEVPCNLYRDKRDRKSHLKTWSDGWRHLRFMLLFTPTQTFLIPGFTFVVIGLSGLFMISLRDVIAPSAIGFITQRHMISFMLVFLLGTHIVSLGIAAQVFSFSRYFDHASVWMKFLHKHFRLERGIIVGMLSIIFSIASFSYLFISYYIGILPYLTDSIRFDIGVFAATLFILGVQFIWTSFLLSLFYIKVK